MRHEGGHQWSYSLFWLYAMSVPTIEHVLRDCHTSRFIIKSDGRATIFELIAEQGFVAIRVKAVGLTAVEIKDYRDSLQRPKDRVAQILKDIPLDVQQDLYHALKDEFGEDDDD